MTRDELIAYGEARHGGNWVKLLAQEISYDKVALWRIATGRVATVSRRIELEIERLESLDPVSIEEWRPIPSLGGEFEASSFGRIKRVMRAGKRYGGRIIVSAPDLYFNSGGYHIVCITIAAKKRSLPLHRLIAEAFLGQRPDGLVINHIDGDKANNRPSNLEYVTMRENAKHAVRLGLIKPPIRRRSASRDRQPS